MANRELEPKRYLDGFRAVLDKLSAPRPETANFDAADPEQQAQFADQLRASLAVIAAGGGDEQALRHNDGVPWVVEDEFFSQLQSFSDYQRSADSVAPRLSNLIAPFQVNEQGLEVAYDDRDLGNWIKSFFQWKLIGKHPFIEPAGQTATTIDDDVRLALFGDWGSGRYGAPAIGQTIAASGADIAMHLGDVYYSGQQSEFGQNFIAPWPRRTGLKSFALNGNHEMYGGGHAYFKAIGADPFTQGGSVFALQNTHFTVIALDSAYSDGDLHGGQRAWVDAILADAGARKIILITHHQPFSAFEGSNDAMVGKLKDLLTGSRFLAWYWGHEHRCAIYDPVAAWGNVKGRCIGHGGYPYFRVQPDDSWKQVGGDSGSMWYRFTNRKNSSVGGLVLGDGNPFVKDDHGNSLEMKYGAHGYVELVLSGTQATERYLRPDGTLILQQTL